MGNTTRKTKHNSKKKIRMNRGLLAIGGGALVLLALILALMPGQEPGTPEPAGTTAAVQPASILPENPYGPEDFVYDGPYLTCTAGNTMLGVDVSSHQRDIDWAQVAGSGMEFAMIRVGYRGFSEGGIYEDEYARANLEGAKEAGLLVGAYFYSQAVSEEEAREEAAFCVELLEEYGLDLPLVYDWEYVSQEARTGAMDAGTLTGCAIAFCEAVEAAGYQSMVYFNPAISQTLLDLEALAEYPFWLALYSDTMDFDYAVDMWQYTQTGNVPGITGDADVNLLFTD